MGGVGQRFGCEAGGAPLGAPLGEAGGGFGGGGVPQMVPPSLILITIIGFAFRATRTPDLG